MYYKTRRELIDQVLANLGVLTPGQIATDDDVNAVDRYVDPVIESLEQREIVSIQDAENIAPRHFLALAVCIADACKAEYGGGEFDVMKAEQDLRVMSRSGPTYEVMQGTYF